MPKKHKVIREIYNKTIFVIEFIIAMIGAISMYKIAVLKDQNVNLTIWYISLVYSFITIGVIILLNVEKYKDKIEKLFITFIIPIGILFAILNPLNAVPDEVVHAYKAYDVSYGHMTTPPGENKKYDIYVPKILAETFKDFMKLPYRTHGYKTFYNLLSQKDNYNELSPVRSGAKGYNVLNYISGGIIFFIARIFNINIFLAWYIIRIVNFILFMIMGYFSIKMMPFGKLLLAIYMFLPMIINQAASASADCFRNNVTILFIAYNFKLLYQHKDLNIKQIIFYLLLTTCFSFAKWLFPPFVLLSLLLKNNKNISVKKRNILIILSCTIAVLIMSSKVLLPIFSEVKNSNNTVSTNITTKVNKSEQIKYIIKNPMNYVMCIFNTIKLRGGQIIFEFVGAELGWLEINIPIIYIMTMLVGLILLPILEKNRNIELSQKQKKFLVFIGLMFILIMFVAWYVAYTEVKREVIGGIQGRYFIPINILFLIAMIKNNNIEIKNIEIKYFITYMILNLLTILEVLGVFI